MKGCLFQNQESNLVFFRGDFFLGFQGNFLSNVYWGNEGCWTEVCSRTLSDWFVANCL